MASEAPPGRVRTILMTADTVGGVWTYALELSRELGAAGVRVVLCTMGDAVSASQQREASAIRGLELRESRFKLEWMDDPWDDVRRAGDWLLEVADQVKPDVVHLNGYSHGALPFRVPALVVAHSCVLSWWRAVKHEHAPAQYDLYEAHVSRGLRNAAKVIAPSAAYLEEVAELYGPLSEVGVIYNGRRAPQPLAELEAKEPFIFSAGRLWDEAKNVATLARVAPRLRWPVKVAGDARSPDGRSETFAVECLGRLSSQELYAQMGRAGIYALPARYEPFGLSPLEAAQQGCPLVLGDLATLREVWGDAARFVPPDDEDALVEQLNLLAAEPALRRQMGERARERARAFGPEQMARAYLEEYERLLKSAQPAPLYATP